VAELLQPFADPASAIFLLQLQRVVQLFARQFSS
jgi:hypothetical protein